MTTSGNPGSLTVTTAVAGSEPTSVSDASTTYTLTGVKVATPKAITAQLSSNMPTGVTLTADLAVGAGLGTSAGPVALDITARYVVTSITGNYTAAITYQFSALASAGVIASQTRTVTFTLVASP